MADMLQVSSIRVTDKMEKKKEFHQVNRGKLHQMMKSCLFNLSCQAADLARFFIENPLSYLEY